MHSVECPSVEIICCFSLDYTGIMGFWEEGRKIKCHSHNIISRVHPINVTHRCCATLLTWPRARLQVSLQDGHSFSRSLVFGRKVTRCHPHFRGEGSCSTSVGAEYLHPLFGVLSRRLSLPPIYLSFQ